MKKIVVISLAAALVASLGAGCGKKSDSSSSESKKPSQFVGKWQCEKIAWNGKELDSFLGTPVNVMLQAELTDDGKFIAYSAMEDKVDADNGGTWTEKDDTHINVKGKLNGKDRDLDLELKDERLVGDLNESGMDVQFFLVRVEEFAKYDPEADASAFDASELGFSIDPSADIDMQFDLEDIDFDISEFAYDKN